MEAQGRRRGPLSPSASRWQARGSRTRRSPNTTRRYDSKPEYAEAHYNLGNVLRAQGKPDEAIAKYSAAIRIKPELAEAHYNLGTVLEKPGEAGRGDRRTPQGPRHRQTWL